MNMKFAFISDTINWDQLKEKQDEINDVASNMKLSVDGKIIGNIKSWSINGARMSFQIPSIDPADKTAFIQGLYE